VLDEDYGLITFVEQSSSETTVSSQWNLHGRSSSTFLNFCWAKRNVSICISEPRQWWLVPNKEWGTEVCSDCMQINGRSAWKMSTCGLILTYSSVVLDFAEQKGWVKKWSHALHQ